MMKHILIFICTVFSISLLIACSNTIPFEESTSDKSQQNNEVKKPFSQHDLQLIEKYNAILANIATQSSEKVQNELKNFIPEALKITDQKERNTILMNIYVQNKMYQDAFQLNSSLLKENPSNANAQKFQCILLNTLKRNNHDIKACYSKLSELIQIELSSYNKNAPEYSYVEWSYYAAMYHAGNTEYKDKLMLLVKSQKESDRKLQFQSMFDAELAEQILP